jgi:hypothetical protein
MLVAVGFTYQVFMRVMQELQRRGLVDLVYPEFFDSLPLLVRRRWRAYLRKLRKVEDRVKVALWPDYCYDERIRGSFSVQWVFPLHHREELDFALKVADYVGFPNRDSLRNYSLEWFLEQKQSYGFRAWLLGLKPRYLGVVRSFDACDITPMSRPDFTFSRFPEFLDPENWVPFLRRLKGLEVTLEVWLHAQDA